jgi:hypothetical protein
MLKPISRRKVSGIIQPNHPIDPIKAKQSAFIMTKLLTAVEHFYKDVYTH